MCQRKTMRVHIQFNLWFWWGNPTSCRQPASGRTREAPNRPICRIPHGTVLRVNKSVVLFKYKPLIVFPPRPFISPWISCPISFPPRLSLTYLSASLLIPVILCSVDKYHNYTNPSTSLNISFRALLSCLSLFLLHISLLYILIPCFPASVCPFLSLSPPSPWFVRSRCHAVLCGSSGDELPLLVNSLFILQPYQPHRRVSSRQLQSRLPSLIMSSDQDFHTSTHSEHAHLRSNNNNNNRKTRIYTVHKFTARSLTRLVYSHTLTWTYKLCMCLSSKGQYSGCDGVLESLFASLYIESTPMFVLQICM